MDVKIELLKQCTEFVNKRLQTVEEIIKSNQKALNSETKSSAGDKHEIGRAMLQLEMEKAGQQVAGIIIMKTILSKIDKVKTTKKAQLGSVIYTTSANYFLSISAGKLVIDDVIFFAISVSSPIGKKLLGKKVNDDFTLNGKKITILKLE